MESEAPVFLLVVVFCRVASFNVGELQAVLGESDIAYHCGRVVCSCEVVCNAAVEVPLIHDGIDVVPPSAGGLLLLLGAPHQLR